MTPLLVVERWRTAGPFTGGRLRIDRYHHLLLLACGVAAAGAIAVTVLSPPRLIALALLASAVTGAAVALRRTDGLRHRIRSRSDLEPFALRVELVAELPDRPGARAPRDARRRADLAYGRGLDRIIDAIADRAVRVDAGVRVLVASGRRGEGRTTVVQHVAQRLGNSGVDTIVVDGDLRRPSLHRRYAVPNRPYGLAEILASDGQIDPHLLAIRRDERMQLLPAGTATDEAHELLQSSFAATLDSIRSDHGALILDSSPILEFPDATEMLDGVDAVLVLVHAGRTTAKELDLTLERLAHARSDVLGIVLVGVDVTAPTAPEASRAPAARLAPFPPAVVPDAAAPQEERPPPPPEPRAAATAPISRPDQLVLPEPDEPPLPAANLVLGRLPIREHPGAGATPGTERKIVIGPSPLRRPPDVECDWLDGDTAAPSDLELYQPSTAASPEATDGLPRRPPATDRPRSRPRPRPRPRDRRLDEVVLDRIVAAARTPVGDRPRPRPRAAAER